MTPLAVALDDSIALLRLAESAHVSLVQARAVLAQLAELPLEQGDRILAEARRERIRTLSTVHRKKRSK